MKLEYSKDNSRDFCLFALYGGWKTIILPISFNRLSLTLDISYGNSSDSVSNLQDSGKHTDKGPWI